jgi:prepilin-type processing-associated H-X9-DG protein
MVELLVVIVIISLLSMIVAPFMGKARGIANNATCTNNLRNLGAGMGLYHSQNRDEFWPYTIYDTETKVRSYFWGSATDPVDPSTSPFLKTSGGSLSTMWCPEQPWGTYVPQGGVSEPTSNYGYNARCLAPIMGENRRPKKRHDIKNPSKLFVFADSAMYWAPGGVGIMQNSAYLEPVSGTWTQTPTTHFRHSGRTNALTVDGSVDSYGLEGWEFKGPCKDKKLGFVGKTNYPHYDQ